MNKALKNAYDTVDAIRADRKALANQLQTTVNELYARTGVALPDNPEPSTAAKKVWESITGGDYPGGMMASIWPTTPGRATIGLSD